MTDNQSPPASPPAAPPVPLSANEVLNSPPPAPAFYESFEDAGVKDWATKSAFKSPEDVAKIAHKFDAFKDADPATLASLPKADDPNAYVSFAREKLGAPTEAAAYGLDKLEGVDKDLATAAGQWFADAGLTPFQAQHLAAKQMEFMKAGNEANAREDRATGERELTQLKSEWSGEYDAKIELGRRALKAAAKHAGVADVSGFVSYIESGEGAGVAMKIAAYFGQFVKEGDFIDGDSNTPPKTTLADRMYADI